MLLVQGLLTEEQWCGKMLFNPSCKLDSPGPCRINETEVYNGTRVTRNNECRRSQIISASKRFQSTKQNLAQNKCTCSMCFWQHLPVLHPET